MKKNSMHAPRPAPRRRDSGSPSEQFAQTNTGARRASRNRRKSQAGGVTPWQALLIVLSILLIAGVYTLYCFLRVDTARRLYEQKSASINRKTVKSFASRDYRSATALAEKARSLNFFLHPGRIQKKYEKATQGLKRAERTASRRKDAFDNLKSTYVTLREQAKNNNVQKYLPETWEKVESHTNGVTLEPGKDFNAEKAISSLEEAVELLENLEQQFPDMADFREARTKIDNAMKNWNKEKWKTNLPKKTEKLVRLIKKAETAGDKQKWQKGKRYYRRAYSEFVKTKSKLNEMRLNAKQDKGEVQNRIQSYNEEFDFTKKLKSSYEELWTDIETNIKKLDKAWNNWNYKKVSILSEKTLNLLSEAKRQVKHGRQQAKAALQRLEKEFPEEKQTKRIYQNTWPELYQKMADNYEKVKDLFNEKAQYLKVQKLAEQTIQILEKLEEKKKSLMTKLKKNRRQARQDLQILRNREVVLNVNYPKALEKVLKAHENAVTAIEKGAYKEALSLFNKFSSDAQRLYNKLNRVQNACENLKKELNAIYKTVKSGYARLHPKKSKEVDKWFKNAQKAFENINYAKALPLYKDIDEELPDARFVEGKEGKVLTDFKTGRIWISDLAAAGAADRWGWYDAYSWVAELDFADHTDWRLPRREEAVQLAKDSDKAELKRLFPSVTRGRFWTQTDSEGNVSSAFSVNFLTGQTFLENKKRKRFIIPLRTP